MLFGLSQAFPILRNKEDVSFDPTESVLIKIINNDDKVLMKYLTLNIWNKD